MFVPPLSLPLSSPFYPPSLPPKLTLCPGGQYQNKTNSAVQIKHLPTGIVVKSQATRSRSQNRKIARDLLALRLDELANGAQSRTAIVGGVKKKRSDSAAKKSRRKYRKLAEAETGAEGKDTEGEIEEGEEDLKDGVEDLKDGVEEIETERERAQAATDNTKPQN